MNKNRREIRIFLSSTFMDLNDERNYLTSITFPELIRTSRERGVTLTVIDLRWGITDEKSIMDVLGICLSEIDKARPHFIGIIAGLYGHVPAEDEYVKSLNITDSQKKDWIDRGLSLTNIEMEYGVLSKQELSEYAYFYFKSDESIELREENQEYSTRLNNLRKEIRKPGSTWHWRDKYSTVGELGDQIREDFMKMLDTLYPKDKIPSAIEKQRDLQEQYSSFLLRNYLPDEEGVVNILDSIEKGRSVLVTGPTGIGKSSMLAYVKRNFEEKYPKALIIEHYIGAGGNDTRMGIASRILLEVKERLESLNIELPEKEMPTSDDEMMNALPGWIVSLPDWERTLVLIDGLDQLPDPTDVRFLAYLPRIRVLVSCRDGTPALGYIKAFGYRDISLTSLRTENRKAIINKVLKASGKELTEKQVNKIASSSPAANPLYLRTLLDELVRINELKSSGTQNGFMDGQIEKYLRMTDMDQLYSSMIERLEAILDKYRSGSKDAVKHLLTSIAVSRNGLSQDEILHITGMREIDFLILRNELDYHLSEKDGLIDFFHASLKDAVNRVYLSSKEEGMRERERIIKWFELQETEDSRKEYELPYQLRMNDEKDKLEKYLGKMEVFIAFTEDRHESKYYEFLSYLRFSLQDFCDGIIRLYGSYLSGSNERGLVMRLATLAYDKGCLGEAEPLLKEALEIHRKTLGDENPYVATVLNNLGLLYSSQRRYDEAEPLYEEALEIYRKTLGDENPYVATGRGNLGSLYSSQRRYDEAEPLLKEALEIHRKTLGDENLDVARDLNSLGLLYSKQGRYNKAESSYEEALEIYRKTLGDENPDVATVLGNRGGLYFKQGRYNKAESSYEEALEIHRKTLGDENLDVATGLGNLGALYSKQGRYNKAESSYEEALEIHRKTLGDENLDVARDLCKLGWLCSRQGKFDLAKEYVEMSRKIYKTLGYSSEVSKLDFILKRIDKFRKGR